MKEIILIHYIVFCRNYCYVFYHILTIFLSLYNLPKGSMFADLQIHLNVLLLFVVADIFISVSVYRIKRAHNIKLKAFTKCVNQMLSTVCFF